MSIKVSVCVPVYNAERYLEACIDSLINQTLKDIELVFVNDGSTDQSREILKMYQAHHKNIIVIDQNNTGLGGARNSALNAAHGEYIGFVDSDDFVDATMYERLYKTAKKNDADIAMCNVKLFPGTSKTKRIWFKPYEGEISADFLNRNTQPWNKLVSAKLIKDSKFEFFKQNGDGMFILLMLKANKIVSINTQLYNYRVGHNSMSTDYKLNSFIVSYESSKLQRGELNRTKYANLLGEYFDYRVIYSLIQLLTIAALERNEYEYSKYRTNLLQYDIKTNKYINSLLKKEFGPIKTYMMTSVLPNSYILTSVLVNLLRKMGRL